MENKRGEKAIFSIVLTANLNNLLELEIIAINLSLHR